MNKYALALVGTAALAFGSVANAAVTIDAGTTVATTGPTTVGSTTTIGYSDANLASPNFSEAVVFTNTVAGLYAITLTTSSSAVDFSSAILNGGGANPLTKSVDDGTTEFWKFANPVTLAAGQYTLNILGTNSGAGSLGGSITISAVPEPATWALMLLGFGGMGFALRRGRKQGIMQLA
jgi:hypothetical protein